MSERIRIQPLAEHEYAVDVTEGTTQTRHRVTVPIEPATSIYEEFPLDTVASYFPDFPDELRTRLAG